MLFGVVRFLFIRSLNRTTRKPACCRIATRLPRKRLASEWLEARCVLAANQFAVIGDYGTDTANELAVANLVKSWDPAFVITAGDNNYDVGSAATIDRNIGKYYQEFIGSYVGTYGPGSPTNRGRRRMMSCSRPYFFASHSR